MTYPYIFEENFEEGDKGAFDTETDTANQLDFPHYKALSKLPERGLIPFSGAYCARWTLAGGTADAILIEGSLDVGSNVDRYFRFPLYFSEDFAASANDTVHLLELLASTTIEACFGFRVVAATGVINLGVGEVAPTVFMAEALERGVWYTVELEVIWDEAAENDGEINLTITRDGDPSSSVVAAIGSLNQGAATTGSLGIQNHLATTTGVILIDNLVFDDTRLLPKQRYELYPTITDARHVFVGPGYIDYAALVSFATDNTMLLYDVDDGVANPERLRLTLAVGGVIEKRERIKFERGCYAVVTGGTDPLGTVHISQTSVGPLALNDANVRRHGSQI
jgi:hypothetical protein